jgi:hypothetical protein
LFRFVNHYPSDGMESITTTGNKPRFTGLELSQLR